MSYKYILNLSLLFLLFILSTYFSYKFEINFFIFFIFSLICNFYLLSSLSKQSSFFHFFLSIYIWLGFWFKFIINLLFNFNGWWGEVALLVNSQFLYNDVLLISIFGISGFYFSHLFQLYKYNSYFNATFIFKTQSKIISFVDFIFQKKKIIFIILFLFSIIIFIINMKFYIYQKGIIQNDTINPHLLNIFKWLLFFGLTLFSCYFLHYILLKKKIYNFAIIIIILENFLSNLSMLSRGMFINVISVLYGIYKMNKYYKLYFKIKNIVIILILTIFLFISSIFIVNELRLKNYYTEEEIKGNILTLEENRKSVLKDFLSSTNFHEIYTIILKRFVGYDSLLAIVHKKEILSYDFLIQSFKFIENIDDVSFFGKIQDEILEETKGSNAKSYFIKTPGIIAFLYYSGSVYFLLLSTLLIGFIFIFFEKIVFRLLHNNFLITSLISHLAVYRLIHFGYDPLNTFKYFLSILLNLLLLKSFYVYYKKIKK